MTYLEKTRVNLRYYERMLKSTFSTPEVKFALTLLIESLKHLIEQLEISDKQKAEKDSTKLS